MSGDFKDTPDDQMSPKEIAEHFGEAPTLSNLAEIQKVINEGETGMMSVEQAQKILSDEELRLKKIEEERYLDPLHVQTPMLQRVQREYPNLNTGAGSSNWVVLATFANLIVELRRKGLSSPDIEHEIREAPHRMFGALYQRGMVKKG